MTIAEVKARLGFGEPCYVAFEGIDGSGKSTQARLLANALQATTGKDAVLTRENGGTPIGYQIRAITHGRMDMDPITEAYLFAADRAEHLRKVVMPSLHADKHVVSDRSIHSSLAYQGAGRGLGSQRVYEINKYALRVSGADVLWPHLTIYLRLPIDLALKRRGVVSDRIEAEDVDFHERVMSYYENISYAMIKPVEAHGSVEEIHRKIAQLLGIQPAPIPLAYVLEGDRDDG